jgi:hypothetical protein
MVQANVKYVGLYVQIVTGACMDSAVQSISVPRHMFRASCSVFKNYAILSNLVTKITNLIVYLFRSEYHATNNT